MEAKFREIPPCNKRYLTSYTGMLEKFTNKLTRYRLSDNQGDQFLSLWLKKKQVGLINNVSCHVNSRVTLHNFWKFGRGIIVHVDFRAG